MTIMSNQHTTALIKLNTDFITQVVDNTYRVFLGKSGRLPQAVIIASYLGLKYLDFLSEKPQEQAISNTDRVFNWLKKSTLSFFIGFNKLPQSMALSIITAIAINSILKYFSIDTSNHILRSMVKEESLLYMFTGSKTRSLNLS